MSLDYTRVTHETLLEDWNNRILADERFKDLTQASIYQFLQETIAGVSDMANYYIGRVAEENYLDTARLDSSVIKLCKNLGYMPQRPIPAQAELAIQLNGPLPATLQEGDVIWFNNEDVHLSFGSNEFILDACYSYELTADDIRQGKEPGWTKTIYYSRKGGSNIKDYVALDSRTKLISTKNLQPIKVFQGSIKQVVINANQNAMNVGTAFQHYDINDVSFSNWYGHRDPFAYNESEYNPINGLCKIGIGPDRATAFSQSNICDIEVYAVELNKRLKNWTSEDDMLNIVNIQSNPDKTVRIYFGNGLNVNGGFKNTHEKLFVQYVSTKGFSGRKSGTAESQLQCQSKIYASGSGRIVNVSNNIKFLFNSDISVGEDFESQDKMKTNAKLFFASTGKLITLKDFESYFLSVTDPLKVNHAITFGEQQWSNNDNAHEPWLMNNVFYTIFNNFYRNYDTGEYAPVNIFNDKASFNDTMMYSTYQIYIEHLWDIVRARLYPRSFCARQYEDKSVFGINCKTIRKNSEERMMLNTKIMSLPPIVHYYDVVGEVLIDRTKNMENYKREVESEIYSWLQNNIGFRTSIYKSDIITKFMANDATRRVNVDIRVSDIVKAQPKRYTYRSADMHWDFTNQMFTTPNNNPYRKNILWVPLKDEYENVWDDPTELEGKQITLAVNMAVAGGTATVTRDVTVAEVSVDDEYMYLSLAGDGFTFGGGYYFIEGNSPVLSEIRYTESSYYKKGNMSSVSAPFKAALKAQIEGKEISTETQDTPYDLPYLIDYDGTSVRKETLERRGANNVTLTGLNENWFNNWLYEYAKGRQNVSNKLDNFNKVQSDLEAVYPILKPIFDDNVLDDNNNIVNFSCDNEIPVVRLMVKYVYGN